jgi:hypothetical protein
MSRILSKVEQEGYFWDEINKNLQRLNKYSPFLFSITRHGESLHLLGTDVNSGWITNIVKSGDERDMMDALQEMLPEHYEFSGTKGGFTFVFEK